MSLGIGAVMAEIAWIQSGKDENGVTINELERGLMQRYGISFQKAHSSINIAYRCGVAYEENSTIYLITREEALGDNKWVMNQ